MAAFSGKFNIFHLKAKPCCMTRIEFKAAVIIQSWGFVRKISLFPDELQILINSVNLSSRILTDSSSSKLLRVFPLVFFSAFCLSLRFSLEPSSASSLVRIVLRANRSSCNSSSRASGVPGGCRADKLARCRHFDLIEQEKCHSTPL